MVLISPVNHKFVMLCFLPLVNSPPIIIIIIITNKSLASSYQSLTSLPQTKVMGHGCGGHGSWGRGHGVGFMVLGSWVLGHL